MYWDLDTDELSVSEEGSTDALDHAISMTAKVPTSSLNIAGVDDCTPVDTMIRVNGERAYITDIGGYGEEEI